MTVLVFDLAPTFDDVRSALSDALLATYRFDRHLFSAEAGERAVVFKLAARLMPVAESWDGSWTVDTEYNRMSSINIYPEATYKYLLDVLGDEVRPAYPDLIVHWPGVDGVDGGNLLVVEAKIAPGRADRERDHAKLVAWCRELRYQYAVRLELPASGPRWAWVGERDDPREATETMLVPGRFHGDRGTGDRVPTRAARRRLSGLSVSRRTAKTDLREQASTPPSVRSPHADGRN